MALAGSSHGTSAYQSDDANRQRKLLHLFPPVLEPNHRQTMAFLTCPGHQLGRSVSGE
jgi:hypothetical protein